ncbi:MAG: pilus assembly protein TadE [Cereibacter sphaeroides]|uniref:Pilus assembly protein TadE n=1 Tax=Cereibacter sphaeroides TaxID=1063 RepID=A0A2W5SHA2_CERSP|nr:MAG: pilus assembly protein TadE [Cereibacter sphaeroides]
MIRATGFLRRLADRFAQREDGTATVEFVIMMPLFLAIFLASFESGLLMTRNVLLERSLDMVVRDLRLGNFVDAEGNPVDPSHDMLKDAVCARTVLFQDCGTSMRLELTRVSTNNWELPSAAAPCADRDEPINLPDPLDVGVENELMLIRACAIFDPIFPTTGIGLRIPKDDSGGYMLTARSAFVNEPA